jgi:hypothetical protein
MKFAKRRQSGQQPVPGKGRVAGDDHGLGLLVGSQAFESNAELIQCGAYRGEEVATGAFAKLPNRAAASKPRSAFNGGSRRVTMAQIRGVLAANSLPVGSMWD